MAFDLDDDIFRHSLERAARRCKVRINTDEMLTVLRADSTLIMAPLREFDVAPATELRNGVDSVFAYIDDADRGIPAGFYTLRVTADATEVGEIAGTVGYVDGRGEVMHKADVQVDVESLTLPDPAPFPHAVIGLRGESVDQDHRSLASAAAAARSDMVLVCCPNGYCWFERN